MIKVEYLELLNQQRLLYDHWTQKKTTQKSAGIGKIGTRIHIGHIITLHNKISRRIGSGISEHSLNCLNEQPSAKEYKIQVSRLIQPWENKLNPSHFWGIERLLSSIKDRSFICDISISTSSTFGVVLALETSPPFVTSSASPATFELATGILKHATEQMRSRNWFGSLS